MLEEITIPKVINPVSCGFPSPAMDYMEQRISLDKEYVKHPLSTYFFVSHRGFHCSNQSSKNQLRETLMPGRTPDHTKEDILRAQDHYTSGFHQSFFICDVFKVKTPPGQNYYDCGGEIVYTSLRAKRSNLVIHKH